MLYSSFLKHDQCQENSFAKATGPAHGLRAHSEGPSPVMRPLPRQVSPRYSTANWPGVSARIGAATRTCHHQGQQIWLFLECKYQ